MLLYNYLCVGLWISEFTRMEIKFNWIIYSIDPEPSTRVCTPVFQTGPAVNSTVLDSNQSWSPAKPKHCRAAPRGCAYVVLGALSECTNNTFLVNTMKPKSPCVPRLGLFENVSGRYKRQVDTGAPEQSLDQPAEKRPRALHFTLLQERSSYEPLVENDSQHKLKEEKKAKKKEKYKKYRKVRLNISLENIKCVVFKAHYRSKV